MTNGKGWHRHSKEHRDAYLKGQGDKALARRRFLGRGGKRQQLFITADVPEKTEGLLPTKSQAIEELNRLLKSQGRRPLTSSEKGQLEGGKLGTTKSAIPKELEPLAQEARKYKSAEEFVKKATDKILADASPWDAGRQYKYHDYTLETRKRNEISPSYYLQEYEKNNLKDYINELKQKGVVGQPLIVVDKSGKIINGNNRFFAYGQAGIKEIPVLVSQGESKWGGSAPRIINLTKSELTDFYNLATRKE